MFVSVVSNEQEENGHTVTTLLKRGDKFGEDELATGDRRTATLMTQDTVELFVVHGDVSCFLHCTSIIKYHSVCVCVCVL